MSPNFSFLKNYQQLQHSITYDELIDLGYAIIGRSETDDGAFWNNALPTRLLNLSEVNQVEDTLKYYSRVPCFYFENSPELKPFLSMLTSQGYKKVFEDAWQFWSSKEVENNHFELVKKVENEDELKVFIDAFSASYQKDDPQNPYGDQATYIPSLSRAWHMHHKTGRIEYFMIYLDDKVVSVATLTNYNDLGYISNVGSIREVRGQGYGKAATLYCVFKSQQNGNTSHCLATEEGDYPNEFYHRIGFSTKFSAAGYSK